ncbi:DEAD/DEAH box helicase [Corynebacterium imitans]|uniref:DEAD/DEAH box helicase n=1 Tax=Corynebacterium imitans TaxID=156978 RepID=UPI001EF32420|nr:DEAD/DEAH box helicase [Corynebacterium imitans]MCG7278136.1 DEAD/DEAH box helicase [Corynebacterium imitans]
MSTFTEAIEELRKLPSKSEQGLAFEKLMVNYFKTDPTLSSEYSEVYRWVDWPFNGGKSDTGIDLVAKRVDDGEWTAIQCKFYLPTTHIQKGQLDSFFEASGRSFETDSGVEQFANRLIISTTDRWSSNAESMLENQLIATNRIGASAIAESPINWDIAYPGSEMSVNLTLRETFEPRPHQATAIEKTLDGFKTHDRGKLIMACGTGKTFTALRLAERFAEENHRKARVLFLVPSISLLSQSLKEWTAQARVDLRSYAVCSDSKVGKKAEDIASYDLEVPVSTNGKDIAERLSKRKRAAGLNVVFSTYQSLPAIHDAQEAGLEEFDLVICDEAHRTTGATLAGEDPSNFSRIHDNDYIKAKKRLYMTATPRLFDETVKGKAVEHSAELYSMDDEAVYGPEFHRLGFGEAVEKGLLTDYKVLIMTVDESLGADAMGKFNAAGGKDINLTTGSAMIGVWNALAKRSGSLQGEKGGFDEGAEPMHRTVAFAKDIKTSKAITEAFPLLVKSHRELLQEKAVINDIQTLNMDLEVQAQHVDGAMNALERNTKLTWLESDMPKNECRVLTNARCLSEGVDVPALDSVVFFNPRNSMVDVVQSVGRVMRKAEGKDYGYIILPVAVAPDASPSEALNDNQRFKVVWQILNALRAHDDRFNAKVNSIALNENLQDDLPISVQPVVDPAQEAKKKLAETDRTEAYESNKVTAQQIALFSLEQWQEAIYTKLVDKVGTRTYWEDWADDVADISKAQVTRIRALLDQADAKLRGEFDTFVEGLRGNLNDSISEDEAISMLSQHLITAPVFDALFSDHDFAAHNPVSQVMQRMVDALDDSDLDAETDPLEKFYASVRVRASEVTSASGKQQVIKELYERFFQKAFKRDADKLGIVYTPVEIVDFILRAADDVSKKHFGRGLSDESVHILDPFTGTGTFMVRLLQSGLIDPKDLARKYANELHATEIMLLAYYVAAVNIETTFNALQAEAAQREGLPEPEYVPFAGIALADTFQIHEEGDILDLTVFKNNNERIVRQKEAPINVIVGNPPYSVGQTSANDDNANLKYPTLDARIAETYAAKSTATNKNSLYDSYLRAFRWATDRIGEQGIVAFVSNGGWIDGNTSGGVRLSMEDDFSDLYVFNLRGNMRSSNWRDEGGQVFGSGSQTTVAILIGVKKPKATGFTLNYAQTPNGATREAKLAIVDSSTIENVEWQSIVPNQHGDWLNQRSDEFATWPVIGEKKGTSTKFFEEYSRGLSTARDAWSYSSATAQLIENIGTHVANYHQAQDRLRNEGFEESKRGVDALFAQHPELVNSTQGSWNRSLKQELARGTEITVDTDRVYTSLYRPFFKQRSYFAKELNDMVYQLPSMFPTQQHHGLGLILSAPADRANASCLAADTFPDLNFWGVPAQFFPRFTWEPVDAEDGGLFGEGASISEGESSMYGQVGEVVAGYVRKDNITDAIKVLYRDALGADVTGDDIFHFVYGKLHDPNYREAYAADLKKMLPHIETPGTREEFDKFARTGKELMDLHVGYEDVQPYPLDIAVKGDESDPETWRVLKMKWARKKDLETGKNVNDVTKLIYNKRVTITGIPAEADEYMLGSRSALAWLIDRYQVKRDKASGIVNDPNDWSDEVGNPRYIVELVGKVTRVAVETVRIVEGLR